MTLKIIFEYSNLSFIPGQTYIFDEKKTSNQLYMEYFGTSRIDGGHIFLLDKSKSGNKSSILSHNINNVNIKSASICHIEDHIPLNFKSKNIEIAEIFYQETGYEPVEVRMNGDNAHITIKVNTKEFLRDRKIESILK